MTRRTNARIAGLTFLLYIAVAFPAMVPSARATGGDGIGAPLVSIARHTTEMRVTIVLDVVSGFCGLVLAVTLYGITRDEDREIAMLAFAWIPVALFELTLAPWLLIKGVAAPTRTQSA